MQKRTLIILVAFVIMNIISFLLMYIDRELKRKNKARIPESVLFTACALFGGFGGVIGVNVLKHKSNRIIFVRWVPIMLIIQVGIIGVVLFRFGI